MGWKDKIKKGVSQIKQARDKYQRDKPKREKAALARLIHKSKIESVRAEIRKSQSRNKSPSGGGGGGDFFSHGSRQGAGPSMNMPRSYSSYGQSYHAKPKPRTTRRKPIKRRR